MVHIYHDLRPNRTDSGTVTAVPDERRSADLGVEAFSCIGEVGVCTLNERTIILIDLGG